MGKKLFVLLDNEIKKGELISLGAALKEMKSLMILAEKIWNEAYEEFNLTIEAFEKLNSAIQVQNHYLSKFKNSSSEEYKAWEISTRIIAYSSIRTSSNGVFATADAFGCL